MTIRKKILIANLLMLLAPLIALAFAGLFFWEGAGVQCAEGMEAVLHDNHLVYTAHGYLHAYWEEMKDQPSFPQSPQEPLTISETNRMREIENNMEDAGYCFSVTVNGETYIDTMGEKEHQLLSERVGGGELSNIIEMEDGTVLISQQRALEETEVWVRAVHLPEHVPKAHFPDMWTVFWRSILYSVLLVAAAIILSNIMFSRWVRRNILKPLKVLSQSSHRIKNGELDFQIGNENPDELGEVCRDFDDMSRRLKESEDQRVRYEKDKAQLLAGISHDLRSPLTSIKGYAEGLLEGIASTPEKQRKYYKAIHRRATDMQYLADTLGAYMSLESGKLQFHLEETEWNRYLKEYLEKGDWGQDVRVTLQCCDRELPVQIDREQMNRVLDNVIQNSRKYKTKEQAEITVGTDEHDGMIITRIKDDGPGVEEEALPFLFDCFYRADVSRTQPGKGSGLGLSIVKQIVAGHKGIVKAENDNGLAILIRLPLFDKDKEHLNEYEKDSDRRG